MITPVKHLIKTISHNYSKTRCLNYQIDILKETNFNEEMFNLSLYNLHRHFLNKEIFFNKYNYNKLILSETDDLEFSLITWNKNALTKLHTHNNECLYKICYGNFQETILSPNNNFLKKDFFHSQNDINLIKKEDYHQMLNLNDSLSLSFHIYNKTN